MRFLYPQYLFLLTLIPGFIWYYFFSNFKHRGSIKFSDINKIRFSQRGLTTLWKFLPALKVASLLFLIIALARPQTGQTEKELLTKGIDIMLTIDVSGSMRAEDFKPNRLEAAKRVLKKFIKGRKYDRIGLVVFSGISYTQAPLTIDYGILISHLNKLKFGMIEDGTAIGMTIANCVNRLRYSKARSKVIILLTDGVNNMGSIDPITAARAAQAMNIRIYTIGVGQRGKVPYPQETIFGKQYIFEENTFNEDDLVKIANITDGKYFRATNPKALEDIYFKIDELEKTKLKVKQHVRYNESFMGFLTFSLLLLAAFIVLENTIFRKIP